MMRSQPAIRLAARQRAVATARVGATRRFASAPPPPPPAGQPAPNPVAAKKESNVVLWAITATLVGGCGFWYYGGGRDELAKKGAKAEDKAYDAKHSAQGFAQHVEAVGKDKYEQLKASGNETLADARVRAQAESANSRDYIGEAQKEARQSYEGAKDYASQSAEAARQRAAEARDAAAAKANAAAGAVGHTYEETKDALAHQYANARADAERKYAGAKDRVAGTYDDAAAAAEAKYGAAKGEARHEAERVHGAAEGAKEDVKQGWFSWLGWGKQKAEDAAWEKDQAKRAAADKVAAGAEDVRGWAETKKSETRS